MIVLKNLSKTHINNKNSNVLALDKINLTLPDTGFMLISGDSGSGKSTLLNILSGLDTFDGGSLTVDGKEFAGLKQKELDIWRGKETSFIFQEFNLIYDYNVKENIKAGKNFQGFECTDEDIKKVLKSVKLERYEDRDINSLSGGEKQRVAIARALVRRPKVLFVDEPTAQIDSVNAKKILAILKQISKTVLVIVASHDVEVKKYAERMIIIKKGKISASRSLVKKTKKKKEAKKPKKPVKQNLPPEQKKMSHKNKYLYAIGLNSIGKHKTRSICLVLLSSLALLFFSLFYMLNFYSPDATLARNIKLENTPYVALSSSYIDNAANNAIKSKYSQVPFKNFYSIDWNTSIKGLIEVEPPAVNAVGSKNIYGQEILAGNYPSYSNDTLNDIVITDYIAYEIINNRIELKNPTGTVTVSAANFEEIIGNSILASGNVHLKICGVIKTNFIAYQNVEAGSVEYDKYLYNMELIYPCVHVAPGFVENYVAYTGIKLIDSTVDISYASQNSVQTINNMQVKFGDITQKKNSIIYEPGTSNEKTINSLNDGEIIVSPDIFLTITTQFNDMQDYTINIKVKGRETKTFKIVGVLQVDAENYYKILLSDNDFDSDIYSAVKQSFFPLSKLIFKTAAVGQANLTSIIKYANNNVALSFESPLSAYINNFSNNIAILKNVMIVFGVFSFVFAMALLYNYITLYIISSKKDIGILRSLGATSRDISKILFTTVGITFALCYIISAILTTACGVIINAFVSKTTAIPFSIIGFSWHLYLTLFAACLFISAIATTVPIVRYSKQTPAKQIKG